MDRTEEHELIGSTLSRQRLWQIGQRKNGNCEICANPAQGRTLCDRCAKRNHHVNYRKPLKSKWAAVDWSEPNSVIADRFGVTKSAVRYQRSQRMSAVLKHIED